MVVSSHPALVKWGVRSIGTVGGTAITAALAWWALVYYEVFINTGVPLTDTAPCLLYISDACSLAMSLCGGKHLFGLDRYSSILLWIGVASTGLAFLAGSFQRRA